MRQNKLLLLLVLLVAATGAWAQTETLLTTITATDKEQASYSMANVATVSFSHTANGSSAYHANWGWWGYGWTATVTAAEGYTITKCVFYDDKDRTATDSEAPFVVETTEEDKTPKVNGTPILAYQSAGIKKIEVYGYTYSVTLAEGTEDFDKWTIEPKTGLKGGETVTATYKGEKKVKSVKAVKKANVWDGDLSKLTAESTPEYATATDGMTITGTLAEGVNVKVSIADKATVTLDNVTINGVHKGDLDYMWAGLTCLGDATIILKDGTENKITGFHNHFPAIYIPGDRHNPENNKTLIIKGGEQGTGKLIARNNGYAAAIGGVKSDASLNQLTLSAGNIEIQGGDIEAYAGEYCAAIGAAASDTCGYIRITGGKILANGSNYGVGIGCGTGMNELSQEAHCGDITITGGNITAFGGGGAAIGSCVDGVCGNITISGGIVMAVGQRFGSPGIGSGYKERFETRCGDILINGGVIQAVGLISAPGIGCGGTGDQSGTCGNITITSGVTKLYAERGTGATNSIGLADNEGQCGTVTIGGTVYWQNGSYVGEGLDYLQQNPIQYEP